jgi:hypothetical protein
MIGPSRASRLRSLAVSTFSAVVLVVCTFSTGPPAAPGPEPAPGMRTAVTQLAGNSARCSGYDDTSLPAGGAVIGGVFGSGGYSYAPPGDPLETIVCVRAVLMYVHYTELATVAWEVYVSGRLAASRTFTLGPGSYYWTFNIDRDYVGPSRICVVAAGLFQIDGRACYYFGYPE